MSLKINFYDAGYCTHPECITIRGGRLASKIYPSMFMHIEHPKYGHILYDTGYTQKFHEETKNFPNKLYAMITPVFVNDGECAFSKLQKKGIEREDISYIIISHFHADHISGLEDFKNAKYIYLKSDYEKVKDLKGIKALLNGFLPGLIPKDFEARSIAIDENYRASNYNSLIESVFDYSYDLFGDGSMIAVNLPGHTSAQMGLYLRGEDKEYLFVADSCWHFKSIAENRGPNFLAGLITFNRKEYFNTLKSLNYIYQKNPNILQVPSHCGKRYLELVEESSLDKSKLNIIT